MPLPPRVVFGRVAPPSGYVRGVARPRSRSRSATVVRIAMAASSAATVVREAMAASSATVVQTAMAASSSATVVQMAMAASSAATVVPIAMAASSSATVVQLAMAAASSSATVVQTAMAASSSDIEDELAETWWLALQARVNEQHTAAAPQRLDDETEADLAFEQVREAIAARVVVPPMLDEDAAFAAFLAEPFGDINRDFVPQTPPQVLAPQTPPQVLAPQTPPQVFVPQTPPPRPRAASAFFPIWGVPITPLAAWEPTLSCIILPFDDRSQRETEDEIDSVFDSFFA